MFQAYKILMQFATNEARILHERLMEFLIGNSILAAAWAAVTQSEKFASSRLWDALPIGGILISVILGIALLAAAKTQSGLLGAMNKIEQDPDFKYMEESSVRVYRDIVGGGHLKLAQAGLYALSGLVVVITIVLWVICLFFQPNAA